MLVPVTPAPVCMAASDLHVAQAGWSPGRRLTGHLFDLSGLSIIPPARLQVFGTYVLKFVWLSLVPAMQLHQQIPMLPLPRLSHIAILHPEPLASDGSLCRLI